MCDGPFLRETHVKEIAININLMHGISDSCECHSVIVEGVSQFIGVAFQALHLAASFESTRGKRKA